MAAALTFVLGEAGPLAIAAGQAGAVAAAAEVPLASVLTEPDRFDGRRLRLTGYCTLGFERSALYLTAQDAADGPLRGAIWLELSPAEKATAIEAGLDGTYVTAQGTLRSKRRGHWGKYAAALVEIATLVRASDGGQEGPAESGGATPRVVEAVAPVFYADLPAEDGAVLLELTVSPSGYVRTAKVVEGEPAYARRAPSWEATARRWVFEGQPKETKVRIGFSFRRMPLGTVPEELGPIFYGNAQVEVRRLRDE